jgi:hypothetical protein
MWWSIVKTHEPTTNRYIDKKPNCQCGAELQWDEKGKAWYCIECPFNTYPKKEKEDD